MVTIEQIKANNLSDLKIFVRNLGNSEKSFRYFQKRPISIISNQIFTILAYDNLGKPIGYGHLDKEGGKTWLGLAVIEKEIGKGIGKIILNHLIHKTDTLGKDLFLTVDITNFKAIKLYQKNGFLVKEKINSSIVLMKREFVKTSMYVSSLAFSGFNLNKTIALCNESNLALEFSSGLPYTDGIEDLYINCNITRMPHNYFAATNPPFVINLASIDKIIRNRSIEHCVKNLKLAKASNSPFFAAHAGFCIDPNPDELGQKIKVNTTFEIEENKKLFITALKEILVMAEKLEIDFLIENNVLAPFNYNGKNPLLCCDSQDIKWLFKEIKNPRLGLLLDTAHLKVSCKTLDLNIIDEIKEISPFIRGIHHSDNDGTVDNNMSINQNYWFLPFQNNFLHLPQVLEVKNIAINEILAQINILKNYGN